MGVFFGLLAAVCWGLGDYVITVLTRRTGTIRAMFYVAAFSLLTWLGVLAWRPEPLHATPGLFALLAATAVCHVLGLLLVYRAFEVGTLSLVSPISAGFAVVTAGLSFLSGESLPPVTLAGATLLIGGVVLATRSASDPGGARLSMRGVPEAIGSAVAFGAMFWLFYFYVQPRLGYVWPLIALKVLATLGGLLLVMRARSTAVAGAPAVPGSALAVAGLAAMAAVADGAAWLAYIRGSHSSFATVVTGLASLFSVVTVLLAWLFLKERLARHQWVGVGAILMGILLVSL